MYFFSRLVEGFFNFLFPKSRKVLELESLSSGELVKMLPPASAVDNDNVITIFNYSNSVVKDMVWEIKYRGNRKMATKIGEIAYDVLIHEFAERALFEKFEKPLLLPMPISGKRRQERGWNQAELISEAIKSFDKENIFKYVPGQLVKHRHTERQTTTSSKKEREENLRNSMHVVHPPAVKNRCIILVDDVYTTGSTFKEARRTLKEAGAKKILCIAIAH
jgi:competence protein ComFC